MKALRQDQAEAYKTLKPKIVEAIKKQNMVALADFENIDKLPARAITNLIRSINDSSDRQYVIAAKDGKFNSTTKPSELVIFEVETAESSEIGCKKCGRVIEEGDLCESCELRELRSKKDWTQGELARRFKVSPRTVRRWESGELNPPHSVMVIMRNDIEMY